MKRSPTASGTAIKFSKSSSRQIGIPRREQQAKQVWISSTGQLHFRLCGVLFLPIRPMLAFVMGMPRMLSCRTCMAIVIHGTVRRSFWMTLWSGRCQLHIHGASQVGIRDALFSLESSGAASRGLLCLRRDFIRCNVLKSPSSRTLSSRLNIMSLTNRDCDRHSQGSAGRGRFSVNKMNGGSTSVLGPIIVLKAPSALSTLDGAVTLGSVKMSGVFDVLVFRLWWLQDW